MTDGKAEEKQFSSHTFLLSAHTHGSGFLSFLLILKNVVHHKESINGTRDGGVRRVERFKTL
jgi:hypothetical protein